MGHKGPDGDRTAGDNFVSYMYTIETFAPEYKIVNYITSPRLVYQYSALSARVETNLEPVIQLLRIGHAFAHIYITKPTRVILGTGLYQGLT